MLVISRRLGESFIIDGEITVTVLQVWGQRVRLGVSAPKNVRVNRQEVEAKLFGLDSQKRAMEDE